MTEHEDLIARLRDLGSQPVRLEVAEQHLAGIDDAPVAVGGRRRPHRIRVVAAFAIGLLAGTSGLATAGALPDGPQEVAHRTLGAVGLKVPHGDRYQGPECGGVVKNHGQYVRSQPKDKRAQAAASRCGKPVQAGSGDDQGNGQGGQGAGCQGPPPWAGKGKPDAAAKAERKQACGTEHEADDEEKPAAGAEPAAPKLEEKSPDNGPSTSQPTDTTATTAAAEPTTTTTGGTTDSTGTTSTTGTTTATGGEGGNAPPSLPVEPPAPGEAS
jgi:hypothetical protein